MFSWQPDVLESGGKYANERKKARGCDKPPFCDVRDVCVSSSQGLSTFRHPRWRRRPLIRVCCFDIVHIIQILRVRVFVVV